MVVSGDIWPAGGRGVYRNGRGIGVCIARL